MPGEYVLTLSCPDRRGIVAAVARTLSDCGGNILDSQQFGDPSTGLFFMRVHVAGEGELSYDDLYAAIAVVAREFGMDWSLHDLAVRPRLLVLVSRFGHCLNDLLFRQRTGALAGDIAAVASNHEDFAELVASYAVPFHHLPVTPETKADQEKAILALAEEHDVDLVVLARYMQVLSPELTAALEGRAINIHHSFLPSFKGAAPYQQAYARGVKLIGATAHYVTAHLDEGPIIEQEVARVDHSMGPKQLAAVGRDLECVALARAVQWHLEHRVLLNGAKTVVFR
jgi:formyltetrahydrofolate deformylase